MKTMRRWISNNQTSNSRYKYSYKWIKWRSKLQDAKTDAKQQITNFTGLTEPQNKHWKTSLTNKQAEQMLLNS